ncbi:hypothetical protein [Yinghuangia soli]|uniref:Uncharacterized protein n=1 Tax=Yinghuangia soli TaxID=2908204 RepID=A0AA41Q4L0_9ACTN|nr:hypothetical protein [Yinghuangia soli]MCF2530334.1 hypothetical protein [Yinghuangia soli]
MISPTGETTALVEHLTAAEAAAFLARVPAAWCRDLLVAGYWPAGPKRRDAAMRALARTSVAEQHALLEGLDALEPCVLAALAQSPDPGIRTAVYQDPCLPDAVRRGMLAGGPGALPVPPELRALLFATKSRTLLGPALDAADPEIAARAARYVRGPRRQPPPQDPAGVHAWLQVRIPEPGSPEAAKRREGGYPRRARRRRVRQRVAAVAFERWTAADWDALAALHHADPLARGTVELLAAHPSCTVAAGLAFLWPGAETGAESRVGLLAAALRAGTFTAADLYERAGHAPAVLDALAAFMPRGAAEYPGTVAVEGRLRSAVRDELGGDPSRWSSLLALLRTDFAGTVPELLRTAATTPPPRELPPAADLRRTAAAPSPQEPPRIAALRFRAAGESSAWAYLLTLAEPKDAAGVVRAVGTPAVAELITAARAGGIGSELLAAFSEIADDEARLEFARYGAASDATTRRIVALDDPAFNAAVVLAGGSEAALRRQILAGTSHATGRPGLLELHPLLIAHVASPQTHAGTKDLIFGPDPERIHKVLYAGTSLCEAYQAAGCRRLAELGRLDLIAAFLAGEAPAPDETADFVPPRYTATPRGELAEVLRGPLADGDAAAALAALDTLSRKLFLEDVAHNRLHDLICHLEIDHELDWAAVAALLGDGSLPVGLPGMLARCPSLPDDVALRLLAAAPDECAWFLASRSSEFAKFALDHVALDARQAQFSTRDAHAFWAEQPLADGLFTAEDLVRRARPAGAMLQLFRQRPVATADAWPVIRQLLDEQGPRTDDGWAVLALMLGDFAGTFPELLATVRAAAAPVGRPSESGE